MLNDSPNVTAEISPVIESYYMQWSERFNGNYADARDVRKSALSARANTAIPARKWCLNSHRPCAGGGGGGRGGGGGGVCEDNAI